MVRDIDVTLGQSVTESFSGLPSVPFVSRPRPTRKSVQGDQDHGSFWVSEEVSVTVSLTHSTSVSLTLYRNGRAKVTIGFDPESDGGC